MKLVLCMSLVLWAGSSFAGTSAEDCTPVDNGADLGPVRVQTYDTGWCYAFADADLLAHELKQIISASAIAFAPEPGREKPKMKSETKTAYVTTSLETAINTGLCLESEVSSDTLKYVDCKNKIWVHDLFQTFEIESIRYPSSSEKKIVETLNELLDQNKIAAIEMNDKIFRTSKLGIGGNLKVTHALVVVGRRWNSETSECEYKLRNNWRLATLKYRRDLESQADGQVWLPESDFKSSVNHLIYINAVK